MKLPLFALAFTLVALSGTPVAAADSPEVLFEEAFAGKLPRRLGMAPGTVERPGALPMER